MLHAIVSAALQWAGQQQSTGTALDYGCERGGGGAPQEGALSSHPARYAPSRVPRRHEKPPEKVTPGRRRADVAGI